MDNFSVRRSRLTLTGDIMKKMHYKIQMDIAKTPTLLDASVDYEFSKAFQLRVGQFMVPFSLENVTGTADVDMINRSQPEEKLVPGPRQLRPGPRRRGFASSGPIRSSTTPWPSSTAPASTSPTPTATRTWPGGSSSSPSSTWRSAAPIYLGKQSATADAPLVTRDKAGLELALVYPRASLKAEYYYAKDDKITRDGWYVQGGYFVLPKQVQVLLKADAVDMNRDLAGDRITRYTAGVNWFIAGRTKLQLNYELYDGELEKNDNHAILAQFQVAF